MFRVTDLRAVTVATNDLDGTLGVFQQNFGFPITRRGENAQQKTLSAAFSIGAAEIEIVEPATTDSPLAGFLAERGPALHFLVLEVDDLEAARADLAARGITASRSPAFGESPAWVLGPAETHGVRIALVERRRA